MKRLCAQGLLLLSMLAPQAARAEGPEPKEISLSGSRVHLSDLVPSIAGLEAKQHDADLGATPAQGATRIVSSREVKEALARLALPIPKDLPPYFRVRRAKDRPSAEEIDGLVRSAMTPVLPPGTRILAIRVSSDAPIPRDADEVRASPVSLARGARRGWVQPRMEFWKNGAIVATVPVQVELHADEPPPPAVRRGSRVVVVSARGLVEIAMQGITSADGDIGGVIPVVVQGTARVVRARLVSGERAELEAQR